MQIKFLSRRKFMNTVGATVFTTLVGCRRKPQRPNILFLFADDQRFDTIHALGNSEIKTPHLDFLVQNGTSFTNAYFMGSKIAPVCAPSRAQLLSGQNLFRLEGRGSTIPSKRPMFTELLRKVGYETFLTGKWHNDTSALTRGFEKGGKILFFGKPKPGHFDFEVSDFDPDGNFKKYRYTEKHSSELIADEVIGFFEQREQSRPFFAYVSLSGPHYPWESPPEYHQMYDPAKISLPANFKKQHPFDNGELGLNGTTGETLIIGLPRTPQTVRQIIADYYAIITHTDAQIGRIISSLKKNSDFNNTIIIFAGDNGMAVGQHGLVSKQNIYEHSVHVPLVFSGPGIPENSRSDSLCYLFDIYPTICDLAGISYPKSIDGKSLIGNLQGEKSDHRDALLLVYKNFQRSMRYKQYKLICYNVRGVKTTQLFDLENDPWENNNLAEQPDYTELLKELFAKMQQLMQQSGDSVRLDLPDWGVEEIPSHPYDAEYWK